ncbi:hypothetical protein [Legionella shakespearei]|uniref:Uncharacterized protein n=1 Tax=Legionella shakespearei DSM 23087 TaxID=1122169 RepID=A0A0W0Z9R8_9GAMM|nr:hypothetical protein [Legionella shakespearei]KTD65864.1 hypothetical protein Lsha_0225 [Legionella shakespearei DSM 23087]
MVNSTSKILSKLQGKKKSNRPDVQEADPIDTPKLQPGSDMAQALSNILGPSFNKEFTPFDQ